MPCYKILFLAVMELYHSFMGLSTPQADFHVLRPIDRIYISSEPDAHTLSISKKYLFPLFKFLFFVYNTEALFRFTVSNYKQHLPLSYAVL